MSLSKRKQYAKTCLLKGATYTRGFDACFEQGDGGEVVKYLMSTALIATPAAIEDAELSHSIGVEVGSPALKHIKKIYQAEKLAKAIKKAGSWDYWLYYYTHGTYTGYTPTA